MMIHLSLPPSPLLPLHSRPRPPRSYLFPPLPTPSPSSIPSSFPSSSSPPPLSLFFELIPLRLLREQLLEVFPKNGEQHRRYAVGLTDDTPGQRSAQGIQR